MKLNLPKDFPQPLAAGVFILEHNAEVKTAAGILLPETNRDRSAVGIIVGVGPNVIVTVKDGDKSRILKIGDRVIFNYFADRYIKHDSVDYLIMHETDVLGYFPSEKTTVIMKEKVKLKRGFGGHTGKSIKH